MAEFPMTWTPEWPHQVEHASYPLQEQEIIFCYAESLRFQVHLFLPKHLLVLLDLVVNGSLRILSPFSLQDLPFTQQGLHTLFCTG